MELSRPEAMRLLHDAHGVVEQARVGLAAQRDVVLKAVVAVIIPSADADMLDAASALLNEPGLSAARAMALVGVRRSQVVAAFSGPVFRAAAGADDDAHDDDAAADDDDDGGFLSVAALMAMRQGLLATRAAIETDLERRRVVVARTQPSGVPQPYSQRGPSMGAVDGDETVDTERWSPQDVATIRDAAASAVDDAVLGLEGALRAVASELADNARLLRRRQEAEVGLALLDAAVIADARDLARQVLTEWLATAHGAHAVVEKVFPVVLDADATAIGVLRASRALAQAIRIVDALSQTMLAPLGLVSPAHSATVERTIARVVLWTRALTGFSGWGHVHEDEDVWSKVLKGVDGAFVDEVEERQRSGDFLAVVADERVCAATKVMAPSSLSTSASTGDLTTRSLSSSSSSTSAASTSAVAMPKSTKLPSRLDRYTLEARLGGGGMGEVFLARQDGPRGFSKRVVIKCIRSTHAYDAHFIDLFQREARVVARLAHENVIAVFEVGVSGGRWFMAVEYLHGHSGEKLMGALRDHTSRTSLVARIIRDAAIGLAHAHSRDVIHRDLSPDNLFVTSSGLTKIIDFGVASVISEDHASDTSLMGKLPYLAPELFENAPASVATDLWGLGVTAFQLLTGSRPFDGGTPVHTVRRITRERVDLSALQHDVFAALIDELLDKDPTRRPTPADVAERLEPLCASSSALADLVALGPAR